MKIGIMSFAHSHALDYVSALAERQDVSLLASDPDHASRAPEAGGSSLAQQLGVDYVDSYDELFAWNPDAVIVCSENVKHRDDVVRAAAAGAHVLCEKPMTTSVADAEAMIQACSSAGVNLMVAFPVRFSPEFRTLHELVRNGDLGRVYALDGANNGKVPGDRAWFTQPSLSGGGALTDHLVHILDMVDALFDGQPATRVYAATSRVLHPESPVETAGLVSVSYDNGLSIVIDCSWSKPPHFPTWGGLAVRVASESGLVKMDAFAHRLDGFSEKERAPIWRAYGTDANSLMLSEFIDAIREGRVAQPDGQVGLRTVKVVAAAYQSSAIQDVVRLS